MSCIIKLPRRTSLLLSGDAQSNILDLGLSIVGAAVVKSDIPSVMFLSDTPTEGRDLCDRLGGWLDNYCRAKGLEEKLAKRRRNLIVYRYNTMAVAPHKLARAVFENISVGSPTFVIRDDTTQSQYATIGHWFAYANEILEGLAVTCLHLVKADTMKQLPVDPTHYLQWWEARDYFPRAHNERIGNAVAIKDHGTGAETIWRDKAQAGGASLWFPSFDEEIAA